MRTINRTSLLHAPHPGVQNLYPREKSLGTRLHAPAMLGPGSGQPEYPSLSPTLQGLILGLGLESRSMSTALQNARIEPRKKSVVRAKKVQ